MHLELPICLFFTAISHSCSKRNYSKLPVSSLQSRKHKHRVNVDWCFLQLYLFVLPGSHTVDLKYILPRHCGQWHCNISFEWSSAFSSCHSLHSSFFVCLHDLLDRMTEPGGKVASLSALLVMLSNCRFSASKSWKTVTGILVSVLSHILFLGVQMRSSLELMLFLLSIVLYQSPIVKAEW